MINKKILEKAQRMQDQMQRDLGGLRVSASSGGGVITATVNGQKELIELTIQQDAVDPDDVEMLQDLVVAAVNEAGRRVDEEVQKRLGGLMGSLGLPGMMG